MPTGDFNLPHCLDEVRAGNEGAARTLVEQLSPLIFKIVRANLPRRLNEEDLAQEIFMRVFEKLHQYRGQVPFEHWVSRISVNACIDKGRYESRRPELRWADLSEEEASALDAAISGGPEDDPSRAVASREVVMELLQSLSPEDRLVVNLLDMEGHTVEEISRQTGWNASLIKVRAFRARRKLRKYLDELLKTRKS